MLSARQLTLERHFQPVFEPLDLDVGAGDLLLVRGPNGCGKTTLLRLLAGIVSPSSGRIERNFHRAAFVGHQLALKDDLSVAENLHFVRRLLGGTTPVATALATLGLSDLQQRLARHLSAGQRKRCALARLLVSPAELWLLDEPYASLDDDGQAIIDALVEQHCQSGGSCVMATHGQRQPATPMLREVRLRPWSRDL